MKLSQLIPLAALLAYTIGAQAADDKPAVNNNANDKPEALVNGVAIPKARLDLRIKSAVQQGQPDNEELRKAIREDLINLEIISQAAVKNGLDRQPEVIQQLELARQSILAGAYMQDFVRNHPIADDVLKQEFEIMKARVGDKEYKLSHILVDSEEAANKVLAELKKGGKFAKIAKARSLDPGSKDRGGELGWAVPSSFVQPFAEAVTRLEKGKISAPVKTQFGWHIIKLEDVRDLKLPTFEEMKPQLERRLQQQAIQKHIEDLRSKARIE